MRKTREPAPTDGPALHLWSHCAKDESGDFRRSGHCIVIRCESPWQGAEALVIKLRKEGLKNATLGAISTNVYERGSIEGPVWFWEERPDSDPRFAGCRESGEGAYYRAAPGSPHAHHP